MEILNRNGLLPESFYNLLASVSGSHANYIKMADTDSPTRSRVNTKTKDKDDHSITDSSKTRIDRARHFKHMNASDRARLAHVLSYQPQPKFGTSSHIYTEYARQTKAQIKNLPAYLKEDATLMNRANHFVNKKVLDPGLRPQIKWLCPLHDELGYHLVRSTLHWIKKEIDWNIPGLLTALLQAGVLKQSVHSIFDSLADVAAMWTPADQFKELNHRPPQEKWQYQVDECAGCILGRMSSESKVCLGLKAGLMMRGGPIEESRRLNYVDCMIETLAVTNLNDLKRDARLLGQNMQRVLEEWRRDHKLASPDNPIFERRAELPSSEVPKLKRKDTLESVIEQYRETVFDPIMNPRKAPPVPSRVPVHDVNIQRTPTVKSQKAELHRAGSGSPRPSSSQGKYGRSYSPSTPGPSSSRNESGRHSSSSRPSSSRIERGRNVQPTTPPSTGGSKSPPTPRPWGPGLLQGLPRKEESGSKYSPTTSRPSAAKGDPRNYSPDPREYSQREPSGRSYSPTPASHASPSRTNPLLRSNSPKVLSVRPASSVYTEDYPPDTPIPNLRPTDQRNALKLDPFPRESREARNRRKKQEAKSRLSEVKEKDERKLSESLQQSQIARGEGSDLSRPRRGAQSRALEYQDLIGTFPGLAVADAPPVPSLPASVVSKRAETGGDKDDRKGSDSLPDSNEDPFAYDKYSVLSLQGARDLEEEFGEESDGADSLRHSASSGELPNVGVLARPGSSGQARSHGEDAGERRRTRWEDVTSQRGSVRDV